MKKPKRHRWQKAPTFVGGSMCVDCRFAIGYVRKYRMRCIPVPHYTDGIFSGVRR